MEARNESDWTPTAVIRLIALIGGFGLSGLGIWLLISGIKADGTVNIKSAVLSGTLRTGSAGLYVCFFALFVIVSSIASAHFDRRKDVVPIPRVQRMFGMFLILLFSLFASLVGEVLTGSVVFSTASATFGTAVLWTILAIFRE